MRIYFTTLFLVGCLTEATIWLNAQGPSNPCILETDFQRIVDVAYHAKYGDREEFVERRRAALVALGAIIVRDERECLSSGHKTVLYY